MTTHPSRRSALALGAAAVAALPLAGCGSSSATSTTRAPDGRSGGAGATSGPGAGTASSPGAGSSAPLVPVADVPVGGAFAARDGAGHPVMVAQPKAGTFVAFSGVCTHMGCTVAPQGAKLVCPCHGSVFDAATGAHLSGPAPSSLPAVAIHVSGTQVVLDA